MTIAFRCAQCNKPLRAADEAAGKRAKCTGCGAIVVVPEVENLRWPPGTGPSVPAAPGQPPTVTPVPTQPPIAKPIPTQPPTVTPAPSPPPTVRSMPPPAPASQRPAADVTGPLPPSIDELSFEIEELALPRPSTARPVAASAVAPSVRPAPLGRRLPRAIGVDAVVARAWEIYKANFGALVWASILILFFLGLGNMAFTLGMVSLGMDQANWTPDGDWLQTAVTYVPSLISIWFFLGGFTLLLNMARDRDAGMGDVFSVGGLFLSGLAVWLIYFVPHLLLSVVCGQLGLAPLEYVAVVGSTQIAIFYLLWLPTVLVLVDQTSQPLEAVSYAVTYVARNIFTLLGLFIVSLCVWVVSFLACGVGLIFGIPFILLLLTVAYTSNTPET